ncbi:glycoside hydrolase family 16 protein [bacterium]|nr:glycoside hydrolase family 16 protein [bacterium]
MTIKALGLPLLVLFLLIFLSTCSEDSAINTNTDPSSEDMNSQEDNNTDAMDDQPTSLDARLPMDIDSTYIITFEDDFDQQPGTLPNANKWVSQLPWGPEVIINNERQYYTDVLNGDTKAPNPFDFDGDSNLIITVGLNTPSQVEATGQDYYSGVLTGAQSTPYRDGYIEAKIFYEPDVAGFWGAFWLLHRYYDFPQDTGDNGKRRTEIDWEFVRGPGGEFLGGPYETDRIPVAYHYDDGQWSVSGSGFKGPNGEPGETVQCDGTTITSNQGLGPVQKPDGGDFAGEWHRYGVWKTDEFVKWYLDGELVASICDPAIVSQMEMYPIINIAIGGNFPGPPDASDYPTSMLVDYITLWEPQ